MDKSKEVMRVSVIIPVYNEIDYFQDCLKSVLSQSYTNLEVILIDDGSSDGCQDLCDKAKDMDSRVKVIHQENKGLSAARNAGLDLASGDYIMFLDSDDFWNPHTVSCMLKLAVSSKVDMVIGEYRRVSKDSHVEDLLNPSIINFKKYITEEDVWKMAENRITAVVVWTKIYKNNLWTNLRFMEGTIHEDQTIMHNILKQCDKIMYTNEVIINYRITPGSIMSQPFSIRNLDYSSGILSRIDYFKEKDNFYRALYAFGEGSRNLIKGYQLLDRSDINTRCILNDLYQSYCEEAKYLFVCTKSLKVKVRMWLFIYNITLYQWLQKMNNKRKDDK